MTRMSSISKMIWDDPRPLDLNSANLKTDRADRWLEWATRAFVVLGVLLRVIRYALDYPLWWDEAFVAVNFIRRDYLDLLRPLDYGQVCPILFLWTELTVIKLLGFSEWSLRLFPLVCAVGAVLLFRHAAGRVVRGVPLLLAVAIFATSFHPILHAADVKPYASDLLAALILLAIALEWRRATERAAWMWAMAAAAPLAIALSHPAIFVAAGTIVGLAPAVVIARRRAVWIAYAAFGVNTVGTFLAIYFIFTRAQAAANLSPMRAQWGAAFPPLDDVFALVKWLATVHTGSMFAYPCGGEQGASIASFLLFAVGIGVLWRRGRKGTVLTCLAPFGVAMVAAAMHRYPYGGPVPHGSPARVMQYLAPGICLGTGIGVAALLRLWRNQGRRRRALLAILFSLVGIGIVPLAADVLHPYRAIHAQRARQFARRFWPGFVRDADPMCLRWDLGIGEWDSTNLNVAVYLCNQRIYSPQRQPRHITHAPAGSATRPIRCVLSFEDPAEPRVAAWLDAMTKRHELRASRSIAVDMAEAGARPRTEHYHVFEFTPMEVAHRPHARAGPWELNDRSLRR